MWEEHTRLMTQLVTLMRVSVVLFTGLRGEPTAKEKSTVKPETHRTQEGLGVHPEVLRVQRPCPAPWKSSVNTTRVTLDFQEHEAAFAVAASLSCLLWLGSPQDPAAQALPHPCNAAHRDICSSRTLKQRRDIEEKKGKCSILFFPLLLLGTSLGLILP